MIADPNQYRTSVWYNMKLSLGAMQNSNLERFALPHKTWFWAKSVEQFGCLPSIN